MMEVEAIYVRTLTRACQFSKFVFIEGDICKNFDCVKGYMFHKISNFGGWDFKLFKLIGGGVMYGASNSSVNNKRMKCLPPKAL